ncbi:MULTISPECIES: helix-turn-helix domain-containing protein [Saccharibacillus]|uniref:helix-turn-helix domain-containing protein n=1 Tax=Saccharibacillus TaxID=456492 RepID=UPI00123A401D|nr:XRE family transcriptional regulator [Saccharibacillus sp. WB 17]MWJ30188.1 helix-turn-helix domain-containing protein [Saccharibacillus sp. WB 17]
MEPINLILSQNLKRLRAERKLSLDKLADLTGISKTMLGQIERGESSPSLTTVWKIANGLKISFTSLIVEPPAEAVVVRRHDTQMMQDPELQYRLYPMFPYDAETGFEVYTVEIDPGGTLGSQPHRAGTEEWITLFAGALELEVGSETYRLESGDAIRFKADRPHRYRSAGTDTVRLSMTIRYRD